MKIVITSLLAARRHEQRPGLAARDRPGARPRGRAGDRQAAGGQPRRQLAEALLHLHRGAPGWVKAVGRLIEQQRPRVADQRLGQLAYPLGYARYYPVAVARSLGLLLVAVAGIAVIVEVTDEGAGVPALALAGAGGPGGTATEFRHGHGLTGMRERVTMLGGRFDAGPLPGHGFRVSARIPLPYGA
jgi:hypothetical protein